MPNDSETRISKELFAAVKLKAREQGPAYRIGRKAGLGPSVLSRLLHDVVRPGDARVLRLARVVGVPAERAFEHRAP